MSLILGLTVLVWFFAICAPLVFVLVFVSLMKNDLLFKKKHHSEMMQRRNAMSFDNALSHTKKKHKKIIKSLGKV